MVDDQARPIWVDETPALVGGNWRHYLDAHRIVEEWRNAQREGTSHSNTRIEQQDAMIAPTLLTMHPENTLKPVEGYLCFYADLLGFSAEMMADGMDSLPDYYGAAYCAAAEFPNVKVYLFSDSCSALAPVNTLRDLLDLATMVISNWRADGLLPRCAIGYGSFVDRRPEFGKIPNNFLGAQLAGTALVDAVNVEKSTPLGSRILVSDAALAACTADPTLVIVRDGDGNNELLLDFNDRAGCFDCLYYLLCLKDLPSDGKLFDHYTWSIASRVRTAEGLHVLQFAVHLVSPEYDRDHLDHILARVSAITSGYGNV